MLKKITQLAKFWLSLSLMLSLGLSLLFPMTLQAATVTELLQQIISLQRELIRLLVTERSARQVQGYPVSVDLRAKQQVSWFVAGTTTDSYR